MAKPREREIQTERNWETGEQLGGAVPRRSQEKNLTKSGANEGDVTPLLVKTELRLWMHFRVCTSTIKFKVGLLINL